LEKQRGSQSAPKKESLKGKALGQSKVLARAMQWALAKGRVWDPSKV